MSPALGSGRARRVLPGRSGIGPYWEGVQFMFDCVSGILSGANISGCILADDMGLPHRTSKQKPLTRRLSKDGANIHHDGVQRGLVDEIISRFEKKGFTLKGLKFITVDRAFAEKQYADLSAKPFFNGLVEYIISGPVVAMVWEGKSVVTTGRKIIGATNPAESAPGTIRGDYAIDIGRNVNSWQ